MSQVKTVKLQIDAEEALKRLDAVEKELGNITKASKKTAEGTSSLSKGLSGIGLAWKAIGIGAVITALQFLAEKFSANQEIMDKVNIASAVFGDVMTKIGGVVMSVVKGLGLLGKAVGKVLKGEFKEAGDLAKQSFDGVKDAVVGNSESFSDFIKNAKEGAKETVAFAKAMTNMQKEVKLAEANQRQLQLTYQKDAELQRQIRDDISLTFEERIAANEELGRILDEQFTEEEALAQKKVALAELELSRNKDNVDLQVAVINAKTELADLDERITGQRSEQLTNLKALEKEQADAIQATIDAENKKLLEQQKAAAESVKIAEAEAKKKAAIEKALQESKKQAVMGALTNIASALGENSKAGKAIAIAQALMDTYAGANKALAQGGIFGAISAAGIVAAGLANVARIKSTNPETGAGGGGGGADTNVPQPTGLGGAGLIPNLENINQNDLGTPEPVQAFVVENDISNAQALQEELEIQATL
jgi:hypothetical protein